MALVESKPFLGNGTKTKIEPGGCCHSKHTRNCCFISCVLGSVFLLLGVVVLAAGHGLLMRLVLSTMPLKPGSERYQSWLTPPVEAHLTGYAFHVTNPDDVVMGMKPILQEVGPFVYKSVTIKDSRDNLVFNEDGETLTYKPRKFYYLDEEQSIGDPDKTFITVPNIPLLSALSATKNEKGFGKTIKVDLILKEGRGTPFINVSFSGLLWGYEDSLPCLKMTPPEHCPKPVSFNSLDEEEDQEEQDDFFEDEGWKRKKRSIPDLRDADFESWEKPKGGFVNCTCNWGLFRDRNVTLREPVTMHHGLSNLRMKGWVKEFNSSPVLNWWEPGSKCDEVGGQDGGTLPPGVLQDESLDIFISLMCRRLSLNYEKDEIYPEDLVARRYIPDENALGSHTDTNLARRNEDNKCYCLPGFKCLRSGVLNLAPCKRSPSMPTGAPLALSYPHFYQADPHFLQAVEGLKPEKERHQFYLDLSPEFGFPLAIRPRFQLNLIISRDEDIPILSKFQEELVLPFLWAQDGFDQPSDVMAKSIRKGLDVPEKYSRLIGVVLLGLGGALLLGSLIWILWNKRYNSQLETIPLK